MNVAKNLSRSLNHHTRLTHIIKFTLAFFSGWLVTQLFPQSRAQWIMISIAVVMGSSTVMGLQFNKALLRASGTLIGGSFGLITFLAPHNTLVYLLTLFVTAFFFGWFSQKFEKKNYVASLGMVTFFIITYNSNNSMTIACLRVIDTIIGISISLLISRFVFPVTSKSAIFNLSQSISVTIAEFADDIFIKRLQRRNNPKFLRIDSQITDAMLKQRNIIDAIIFSTDSREVLKKTTLTLLRYNRAIYHYMLFIDTALWENRLEKFTHTEIMQDAIQPFMKLFSLSLREEIESNDISQTKSALSNKIDHFTSHQDSLSYSESERERQHAIQFSMRRMIYCLDEVIRARNSISQKTVL